MKLIPRHLILATLGTLLLLALISCGQEGSETPPTTTLQTLSVSGISSGYSVSTSQAGVPQAVPTGLSDKLLPPSVPTQALEQTRLAVNTTVESGKEATYTAFAALPTPTACPQTPVLQKNYGTWNYKVQECGGLYVTVHYDDKSIEGIKAFAQTNHHLLEQMSTQSGQVQAVITFYSYMLPDDFRAWVKRNSLQVQTSLVRVELDQEGQSPLLTANVIDPQENDALPQAMLDYAMTRGKIPGRSDKNVMRGVYCTFVTIDAMRLTSLAGDSTVFSVELMRSEVRAQLATAGFGKKQIEQAHFDMLSSPFPEMEYLGLENFRK